MERRKFIKTTTAIGIGALLMPFKTQSLFANNPVKKACEAIPLLTLNNNLKIPQLGFGTLYLNDELGERCVAEAIELGYRLIDTAKIYGNEKSVGTGIKNSGIEREKLFLTSKVWVDDHGYENTIKAFEESINKLQTDYLDMYLIHRPRGDVKGTWQAMEKLYADGKIKAIGLSNFEPGQLKELLSYAKIKPVINQIETHAFFQQYKSYKVLKKSNIQMEAWSPLAQGRNGHFTNEAIAEIGKKYNKSNAQVSLRWHMQRGIVAIPRSSNKEHMKENLNIFDFELSKKDLKIIEKLDLNKTQFPEWE